MMSAASRREWAANSRLFTSLLIRFPRANGRADFGYHVALAFSARYAFSITKAVLVILATCPGPIIAA